MCQTNALLIVRIWKMCYITGETKYHKLRCISSWEIKGNFKMLTGFAKALENKIRAEARAEVKAEAKVREKQIYNNQW